MNRLALPGNYQAGDAVAQVGLMQLSVSLVIHALPLPMMPYYRCTTLTGIVCTPPKNDWVYSPGVAHH